MASIGMTGKGGKLHYMVATVATPFGKYTKLKVPEIATSEITFLTLDTDSKHVLAGVRDNGKVTGTVVYLAADFTAMYALIGVDHDYVLTFPPGATGAITWSFSGKLTKMTGPELTNEALVSSDFEVSVDGEITAGTAT